MQFSIKVLDKKKKQISGADHPVIYYHHHTWFEIMAPNSVQNTDHKFTPCLVKGQSNRKTFAKGS